MTTTATADLPASKTYLYAIRAWVHATVTAETEEDARDLLDNDTDGILRNALRDATEIEITLCDGP